MFGEVGCLLLVVVWYNNTMCLLILRYLCQVSVDVLSGYLINLLFGDGGVPGDCIVCNGVKTSVNLGHDRVFGDACCLVICVW